MGPGQEPLPLIHSPASLGARPRPGARLLSRAARSPLVALACLLLTALAPAAATASDGIFLSWNDCPLGGGAAQNLDAPCDANTGESVLDCSLMLGAPTDSVLAIEITLDIQHSAPALPPWWDLGTFPVGCRSGSLAADADFTALASCDDPWQGATVVGGAQSYTPGQPRGGANQARMRVALATTFDQGVALAADQMYHAARIVIDHQKTVSPGECAGCSGPACLVLNAILIGRPPRPPGVPGGTILLDVPGPGHPNWVTWRGGLGADCNAVPVRRVTWGRVKSLYR